jgi:hypothetical protein
MLGERGRRKLKNNNQVIMWVAGGHSCDMEAKSTQSLTHAGQVLYH